MPCGWSYRSRHDGLTHFCTCFCFRRSWVPVPTQFRMKRSHTKMRQAITSRAIPPGTPHGRPLNVAAITLGAKEHPTSQARRHLGPCEAKKRRPRYVIYSEKHSFFAAAANPQNKSSREMCGFPHHKGEDLPRVLFPFRLRFAFNQKNENRILI